jgi:preprotein translocase subunit SecD
MNRYPLWKNLLILASLLIAILVSLPNVFGTAPAVLVTQANVKEPGEELRKRVEQTLTDATVPFERVYIDAGAVNVSFLDVEPQLRANDTLREKLGDDYTVAMSFVPRTPAWLSWKKPMNLGLDLRGGVHFLFQVDVVGALEQMVAQAENDFRTQLRKERIFYTSTSHKGDQVRVVFKDTDSRDKAATVLAKDNLNFQFDSTTEGDAPALVGKLAPKAVKERQDFAIEQNLTTLRKRVDALGVAEPVVQRQGLNRIVVELPGIQDPGRAERVLGAVATLEFHLVDT